MDSGTLAEVEYELLPEDLAALRLFFLNEVTDSRKRRANRLWAAACIAGGAFGVGSLALNAAGLADWESRPLPSAVALAILAPAVLLVVGLPTAFLLSRETPSGVRRQARREVERAGPDDLRALGPKRLILSERGFRLSGDGFEIHYEWRIVPKVLRDLDRLYLCEVVSQRQMIAFIVPGRGFPSQAAFDDFGRLAERCWRAANVEAVLRKNEAEPIAGTSG